MKCACRFLFLLSWTLLISGCEEKPTLADAPMTQEFRENPEAQEAMERLTRGGTTLPSAHALAHEVNSVGPNYQDDCEASAEAPQPLQPLSISTQGTLASAGELPNLRRGCESIGSCGRTNNLNRFVDTNSAREAFSRAGGCEGGQRTCPRGMAMVCSAEYFTKVCVDVELKAEGDGTPEGNHTFHTCQRYCESRGARLLTNNEWLVAAAGTRGDQCLPSAQQRNSVTINTSSGASMRNLQHNRRGIRQDRSGCVSAFGIRDTVGVLGQWVTGGQAAANRAQFNGGLWRQGASTLFYRTTAHGPGYTDYSIGCRCAKNP